MFSPRGPPPSKKKAGFMLTKDSWATALKDHQKRIREMRPAISIEEPWLPPQRPKTARPGSARPHRPGTAGASRAPAPAGGDASRESPARGAAGGGGGGRHAKGIDALSDADQEKVRDVIAILVSLDTARAKACCEDIFHRAEDQRLLRGYTGVFPTLCVERKADADAEAADSDSKKQQPAAPAAAADKPAPPTEKKPAAEKPAAEKVAAVEKPGKKEKPQSPTSPPKGKVSPAAKARAASTSPESSFADDSDDG